MNTTLPSFRREFPRITQGRRCAFTLIELLVVISIIAVLISILLPALSSAREHGKTIKCGAQLQQIGVALTMCQNEYQGYFPLWDDGERSTVNNEIIATWMDVLKQNRMLGVQSGYCPRDSRPDFLNHQRGAAWNFNYPLPQTSQSVPVKGTDYSYAISVPLSSGAHRSTLPYTYGSPSKTEPMKAVLARNPSRRVLVSDGWWNWLHNMSGFGMKFNRFDIGSWFNNTLAYRHGITGTSKPAAEVLKQDMHVEKVKYDLSHFQNGVNTNEHYVTYPGESIAVYPALGPTEDVPDELDPWAITGTAIYGTGLGWRGEIRIHKGWDQQ